MNEFKGYHPFPCLLYFIAVIGFSMFFLHPVSLAISLLGAGSLLLLQKGMKAVRKMLLFLFPLILAAALINPSFNHQGVTVLTYLPDGNPLTLESILYGLSSGAMLTAVILWFSCFGEIMTSDKIIYLFGRIIPSLSLVFSMTLRFIPRFAHQLKSISKAQKCIGHSPSAGSLSKRAKNGLSVLSAMTTWALENSIDTSDSMKSRGYGLSGRTSFSIFCFTKRDGLFLFTTLILSAYVLIGSLLGKTDFSLFPMLRIAEADFFGITVFSAYLILCMLPTVIELSEVREWKR